MRARIAELTAAREIDDAVAKTSVELGEIETALEDAASGLGESEDSVARDPRLSSLPLGWSSTGRPASAARLEALELRHRDAATVHAAAAELPCRPAALDAARDAERLAHEHHLEARSALVDVREARISSMAAHLASQLSPGAAVPGLRQRRPSAASRDRRCTRHRG